MHLVYLIHKATVTPAPGRTAFSILDRAPAQFVEISAADWRRLHLARNSVVSVDGVTMKVLAADHTDDVATVALLPL